MPIIHSFAAGVSDGNSAAAKLAFPEIEGLANSIDSISAFRGGGRLLTDGDKASVGISHQTDLLTADLLNDEDDILTDQGTDLWWVHGISETDHVLDRLNIPEVVAGPQTLVFHNGTGGVTGVRMDISFHTIRIPNITDWTLLKTRTSYEGKL